MNKATRVCALARILSFRNIALPTPEYRLRCASRRVLLLHQVRDVDQSQLPLLQPTRRRMRAIETRIHHDAFASQPSIFVAHEMSEFSFSSCAGNRGCAPHMEKDDTPPLTGWCVDTQMFPGGNIHSNNNLELSCFRRETKRFRAETSPTRTNGRYRWLIAA